MSGIFVFDEMRRKCRILFCRMYMGRGEKDSPESPKMRFILWRTGIVHGCMSVSFLSLPFFVLPARTRQVNGGETGLVPHRLVVLPVRDPGCLGCRRLMLMNGLCW